MQNAEKCWDGLVGHNARLTRERSRFRSPLSVLTLLLLSPLSVLIRFCCSHRHVSAPHVQPSTAFCRTSHIHNSDHCPALHMMFSSAPANARCTLNAPGARQPASSQARPRSRGQIDVPPSTRMAAPNHTPTLSIAPGYPWQRRCAAKLTPKRRRARENRTQTHTLEASRTPRHSSGV